MVSKIPNLTLDTSCIIPLLQLPGDHTNTDDVKALEKIRQAHDSGKLRIWVSQKSINETLLNLEISGPDQVRINKWLRTLNLLEEFDVTQSVWILGVSRLGVDTVLGSDNQTVEYEEIKNILIGNKLTVSLGDTFDIAILYEHRLQDNELFVSLDNRMFRKTVVDELFSKFAIRIVAPKNTIDILKTEYSVNL